jgi:hypothetical protein
MVWEKKIAIFKQYVPTSCQNIGGILIFLKISSLTSNEIWLNPLGDDCQTTYLTNLRKKHWYIGTLVHIPLKSPISDLYSRLNQ